MRKRDKGVCAHCGLDCEALKRKYRKLLPADKKALKTEYGIPEHRHRRFWDIDHIIPVIEGGGACGPENLRTLCPKCHRVVTSELAAKRAADRRLQKQLELELGSDDT